MTEQVPWIPEEHAFMAREIGVEQGFRLFFSSSRCMTFLNMHCACQDRPVSTSWFGGPVSPPAYGMIEITILEFKAIWCNTGTKKKPGASFTSGVFCGKCESCGAGYSVYPEFYPFEHKEILVSGLIEHEAILCG